ncbi:hypothetical protein TVAG_434430 [Trichomonas vaginalis G3]|uniref:Uncharacterized protein n=1 Tax=Trichomonas vaginalis (strain ATCC PRA-98 / G3) TaxID=412133 RepID=A2DSM6_TRIV3|nr:hypothetical protein TVAGG3_0376520 [Trichomonas vaginalis G3]EAY16606.1 hypothetical protein TVAG_434430 [Trichomonas vaginalis G3]KAI5532983.1 hypothetical protein TVAGG3_0376520 [Trichomonas vaginalis G3]|eukprot:XP_001328829.1 hypothetical protein [Trichomonas vaginalis G3]
MAAMMLPTSLIVLFNILCACDSLERNFEKDYKANRFTPELNQNLIDQTNGDKKDPEKPSVAYDDNDDPLHINQTQKPQFVDPTPNPNLMYYPPPEMPSNNKPDEDNPYNQDNPYS